MMLKSASVYTLFWSDRILTRGSDSITLCVSLSFAMKLPSGTRVNPLCVDVNENLDILIRFESRYF